MILQAEVSDLLLESMSCFLYGLIQCKESHHDELKFTDFGHCSLGSKCLSCIGYTKEECSKREGASKAPYPLRRFVTWHEHKQLSPVQWVDQKRGIQHSANLRGKIDDTALEFWILHF